ncbi:MAG: amidohydrolase family protein [Acidobacteria bacterium]|nr:amidohydrolase family protein [Acidobacteriota bacterium]
MSIYRAEWVLPIAAPLLRDGWVAIERGCIAGVGTGRKPDAIDLGRVVILPALVNAHTHLELSYLRGVVPPTDRFLDWIRAIMAARRQFPNPDDPAILKAARAGIEEARASGTGLMGDISNSLVTVPLLREAAMPGRVFYELLGFNADDTAGRVRDARAQVDGADSADGDVRVALAPHAPYSVSPGLFSAIREDLDAHPGDISSVHLGESAEEVEFIGRGTGGWRDVLTGLGVWTDAWRVPGVSPVRYLADLGFLDSRVLAVHGVQCDGDALSRLRALRTTVVSCPRSNRYVGVGDPPLEAFYATGVSVAFGTDSLASVGDLNMFGELAAARQLAPRVSARQLLESATLCGARALGFGEQFGSLEQGKQAALVAVQLPARVSDVEEYLLSGIEPAAITWLDRGTPKS